MRTRSRTTAPPLPRALFTEIPAAAWGSAVILLLALALAALLFGGVNLRSYAPLAITVLLLGLRPLASLPQFLPYTLRPLLLTMAAILAIALLNGTRGALVDEPHPVLTTFAPHASFEALVCATAMLAVVAAVIAATVCLVRTSPRLLALVLPFCAVFVSLVALLHWLHDTGSLFWMFAPQHVFVSTRARWPFVNANHLGHFLLPLLFLILGLTTRRYRSITQTASRSDWRRTLDRARPHLPALILLVLTGLITLTAIVATGSRSSWLGMALATAFLACAPSATRTTGSRRFLLTLLVGALPLILLMLGGRGSEILAERVQFGLERSHADLRWQMYRDSLPLIAQHPFLGVGLGRWQEFHAPRMSPDLAGLTPGYLHNEPLQLVIELGVPALLPLLLLLLWLGRHTVRALRARHVKLEELRFSSAALIALAPALLLDFPLRIPAVCAAWSVALGVHLALLEKQREEG